LSRSAGSTSMLNKQRAYVWKNPLRARLLDNCVRQSGCLVWKGNIDRKTGYGRVWNGQKYVSTHRLAYEQANGRIPPGMCVLHKCDRRPCINPDHLFLGTRTDNAADRQAKGRTYNGRRKLTAEDASLIRSDFSAGATKKSLLERYPISRSHLNYILRGASWSQRKVA
jgi:hypothetical protein